MQKIRVFFTGFLCILSLPFLLVGGLRAFSWENIYDYSEYNQEINISSFLSGSVFEGESIFPTPRTTFIFAFDGYRADSHDDIQVEWIIDGTSHIRELDVEGPDDLSRVTTFPLVVEAREKISYKITFFTNTPPKKTLLISSNQSAQGKKLTFTSIFASADEPLDIISRSEWGADETLRYITKERREERRLEWIARGMTPKIIEETESERKRRLQGDEEFNRIYASNPDANNTYSLKRFEGENKLFWPIKKSKKIDRIVLHHTAESLDKNADDETLIRAIYFYHTKTKGWGDIGYNYIVGQRGKIYEGRAGGDFVEGAHAYGNNVGTVGISVIGNYDILHLNRDQKAGLFSIVEHVVRKYGIDLRQDAIGAVLCKANESCIWRGISTSRIVGHRDLGSTSCPGKNLYELIPEIRNTIVGKVGNINPLYNAESSIIEKLEPEYEYEYRLNISQPLLMGSSVLISRPPTSTTQRVPISLSLGGKPIKIRLSYPLDSIKIRSAGNRAGRLMLDTKSVVYARGDEVSVTLSGQSDLVLNYKGRITLGKKISLSSDLVSIPSWSRIPVWDTLKRYNDNIFRGKLIILNQNGKLLVINELPIEDYLKGLGEVSNTDLPEKIKTITIAARSYAYHYINPKNRKYSTLLYDGSDSPDEFQRYLGYSYESRSPEVSKYVKITKGQVITYNNTLIKPWYFSSSDGRTLSYKEYCESRIEKGCVDIPYLQSVDDPAGVGKVRNGHGVGISGVGATYLAGQGKKSQEIIAYYLKGVKIERINSLK